MWDSVIPFDELWEQYKRIIKKNGAIVLTACQPFTTALIASNYDMYKYNMVWKKPQGVDPFMKDKRPLNNYEDICVFYKEQPTYNPQMEVTGNKAFKVVRDKDKSDCVFGLGENDEETINVGGQRNLEITGTKMKETVTYNDGRNYPTRILEFKQERGFHPTQKPTALFEYLIRTFTNEGELVLDNCAGSGTTAIAAIRTNRNYIVMEQEKKYIDVIEKRIKEEQENKGKEADGSAL